MKELAYEVLFRFAAIAGIPFRMFTRVLKNQDTNLLVMTYHDVTKNQLQNHLHFLDKYFVFVDIDEVAKILRSKQFPTELTASLTFDDGLESFYNTVFPIVEEIR